MKYLQGNVKNKYLFLLGMYLLITIFSPIAVHAHPISHTKNQKVLVLIPGSKNDLNFSQAIYDGMGVIKQQGYTAAFIDNAGMLSQDKLLQLLDKYYNNGFHIIVGGGHEFSFVITEFAKDHTDAFFAVISGNAKGKNVVNYCLDCIPIGGCLAASAASVLTHSKIVGFVGGVSSIEHSEAASFTHTLKLFNSNIKPIVEWTENWNDKKGAEDMAVSQINRRADVLITNANASPIHVVNQFKHVKVIGWMSDQTSLGDHVVATNVVINVGKLFKILLTSIQANEFRQGTLVITGKDGVWELTKFNKKIVSGAQAELINQRVQDVCYTGKFNVK
ncbi:BMP family ABC transporter substrate-binding protein [Legionella nagasakiensis]|uniref:BMP family ABC transporter substrate-binding protein n=1 Tax=Legionella nagasakiensis TaxID=535290 RepID=UPI001055AEE2|nr:BMP family ABC transporter substrate-binding protein [Legionella nagasakiensis]